MVSGNATGIGWVGWCVLCLGLFRKGNYRVVPIEKHYPSQQEIIKWIFRDHKVPQNASKVNGAILLMEIGLEDTRRISVKQHIQNSLRVRLTERVNVGLI